MGTNPSSSQIGRSLKPGLYGNFGYSIHLGKNGAILVKANDWLSKYSVAIHCNPWTVNEYGRRNRGTRYIDVIDNVDLIHVGETIFHIPSVNEAQVVGYVKYIEPTEEEKRRALLEFAKRTGELTDEQFKTFTDISKTLDLIANTAELIGLLDDVARFSSIAGKVGVVGKVAGPVGIVLMPIGMMLDVINAMESGRRALKKDAMVDAIVAWAFDDPKPPWPKVIENNIIASGKKPEIELWKTAWREGVDTMYEELPKFAIRRMEARIIMPGEKPCDPVLEYKLLLRFMGKNERWKLRSVVKEQLKK